MLAMGAAALITFSRDTDAAGSCNTSGVRVEYASSILSQVPVGATVTHKARVRSGNCDLEGVTLTIVPPGAQTLVSTGNTGAWSCTTNPDQSLTCTRPAMAAGIVSTLTLTYEQGPYQDGNGRLHGCVTAESPPLEKCAQAYFTALP